MDCPVGFFFVLNQSVKLGWSVKLSRHSRFHFQGLKFWFVLFKSKCSAFKAETEFKITWTQTMLR
jgi:hypothetical protein